MEEVKGLIAQGKATLQAKPAEYQGMWFQTSMEGWPDDQQVSALVKHNPHLMWCDVGFGHLPFNLTLKLSYTHYHSYLLL